MGKVAPLPPLPKRKKKIISVRHIPSSAYYKVEENFMLNIRHKFISWPKILKTWQSSNIWDRH